MPEGANYEAVGRDLLQERLRVVGYGLRSEFCSAADAVESEEGLAAEEVRSMYRSLRTARLTVDHAARATPEIEPDVPVGKLLKELADARGEDIEETIERIRGDSNA